MNFFKKLKAWSWIEILLISAMIAGDNLLGYNSGMWFSLMPAGMIAVTAILTEKEYQHDLPLNHPDQPATDKELLSTAIRSSLSVGLCVAPIIYGHSWVQIVAVALLFVTFYAAVFSGVLYFKTKSHVKYVA